MDAERFCQRYHATETIEIPDVSPDEIRDIANGDFDTLYQSSNAWSELFGTLLQNSLIHAEKPSPTEFAHILELYQQWDSDILSMILSKSSQWYTQLKDGGAGVETLNPIDQKRHHAAFHEINRGHLDQWRMLLFGASPEDIRLAAQDSKLVLSILGCHYSRSRDQLETMFGEPQWQSEAHALERGSIEGFLHENDAGIVLHHLAADRDNSWICLPSPAQFEIFAAGIDTSLTNANIDFIVIDPVAEQVIGVQVKSRVESGDVEAYDQERIILVDSRREFGNEAPKRIHTNSSLQKVVSWGGQIATEHLANLSAKHRRYRGLLVETPGVMGLKSYAKKASKGSTPQLKDSANRISQRVKRGLAHEEQSLAL